MTKRELLEKMANIHDDEEIMVDVILYNNVSQDMVQTKRFDIMSIDEYDNATVISVQCPDDEPWTELG